MSELTPREIADARLARGEITVEEHSRITSHISNVQPVISKNSPQSKTTTWDVVKGLAGIAVVIYGVFYFIGQFKKAGPGKFDIGSIHSTGAQGVLSFKITNVNNRTDDVVMYVVQDNIHMCEHIAKLDANSTYNIKFLCSSMGLGTFTVTAAWASYRPEIASVASRL